MSLAIYWLLITIVYPNTVLTDADPPPGHVALDTSGLHTVFSNIAAAQIYNSNVTISE